MKKTITLLPLALIGLALSFTACDNESRSELNGGETTLELSSSIGQNRVTTQSDQKTNHWDGNEQIGVFSTSLTASNVLYKATTAGASTDFTTQDPISIPYGTEQHDIKAYYPYDAAASTEVEVEFDLTKKNSQPLLYATGTATNANPKLNLNFGHKLGKLRIKVVTTNSLNPTEPVSKVSVNEVLTKGSLNIESGDFTVDNTTKANLDLKAQGEEFYTYLMPGESIKGKVIAIEHGGKVYKATLANDKTVEAGKYYRYTISLSNGSAKIEDGSGTIDNEDEGDTGIGELIGAPEEDTTPSAPVTATLTSTNSEYASGTLSASVEGGSYTFTLAGLEAGTQVSAKADPAADWVTFSGDVTLRAAADQTFTVKVEANETTEKRETTITLTAEGMNDLTFAVQQAAKQETPQPDPEQPVVDEGDGTEANPYSVAQAISKQGENGVYVKGYIIGAAGNGPSLIESSGTNILLAESMDETDVAKMIPVQLPKGAARDALNLKDNPENKGKLVAVNGDLTAYYSVPGLKNVKEYKFL